MTKLLLSSGLAMMILMGAHIVTMAHEPETYNQGKAARPCPIMEMQKKCHGEMEQMKQQYMQQFQDKNMDPTRKKQAHQQWEKMKQAKMSQCKAKLEQMKAAYKH